MATNKWFGKKHLNTKVWQHLYETMKPASPTTSGDDAHCTDKEEKPVLFTLKVPTHKKRKLEEAESIHSIVSMIRIDKGIETVTSLHHLMQLINQRF